MTLLAIEEIVGQNGINAVLNQARLSYLINNYPPSNLDPGLEAPQLGWIMAAMEGIYGVRAGRGLALRAGRAAFKFSLREFGPGMGLTDLGFRLLPLSVKMRTGLEAIAQVLNRLTSAQVTLEEEEGRFIWRTPGCALAAGRQANEPVCHLMVGLIQEALYWFSGGRYFNVEEVLCSAAGAEEDVILIDKQPMD
jgi:predicted hydrocarbon binding protein